MLNWLIGFRKFTVVILAMILSTVFLLTKHIPGSDYAKTLAAIVTAFCASNIGEYLVTTAKEWVKTLKDK